jgi:Delta24-sterol reductase
MEQLARATLRTGQLPHVVPEFRGITVGGAISGAAIESSSHRFGLFHDNCTSYEVRDGRGETSRVAEGELFHALPGAYGSLGLITEAEIQLMPARDRITLDYQTLSLEQAVEALGSSDAPFIDALLVGPDRCIVMEGRFGVPASRLYRPRWHSPWFYQHAQEASREEMSTLDYLFRFDRGAFWMGRYLSDPMLLLSYGLKRRIGNLEERLRPRDPGALFRTLFGWAMSTEALYRGLHAMPASLRHQNFLIQDVCIPLNKLALFLEECPWGIYPLWLCPVRPAQEAQLFAPHAIGAEMVVNVGIYGAGDGYEGARHLEQLLMKFGGRKALYSLSQYTPEQFWSLYDAGLYRRLRSETGAEGVFDDILTKLGIE